LLVGADATELLARNAEDYVDTAVTFLNARKREAIRQRLAERVGRSKGLELGSWIVSFERVLKAAMDVDDVKNFIAASRPL
jgi:predicted O-linked N-acetylglucosamine transferase (SPINDLY family)